MKKAKAYFIRIVTGWRNIDVFGAPRNVMGTFIVCLKNGSVMEMNYSNINGDIRWWKIGVGDESKENPVMFWRPSPKAPCILAHK